MLGPFVVAWPPATCPFLERGDPDVCIRLPEAPAGTFEGSTGARIRKERA
jgi:hypothetical protein